VGWQSNTAFLTVNSSAPLYSVESETQLDRLHAVAPPGGRDVQFTGWAQINRDGAVAISSRLPVVLSVIVLVTFGLMFLVTGSVVLPLKTLVLNVLSLTAAFGALVWIFQDGNLGGLGTTATGTLVASVPVLLFCLAFGLSMDYEVFLISRIREFWVATSQGAADNEESVARGLAWCLRSCGCSGGSIGGRRNPLPGCIVASVSASRPLRREPRCRWGTRPFGWQSRCDGPRSRDPGIRRVHQVNDRSSYTVMVPSGWYWS
jgi:hypothetical protein